MDGLRALATHPIAQLLEILVNSTTEGVSSQILNWLASRLDPASMEWVQDRLQRVRANDKKGLFLSFGLTPRKVGKSDLALTTTELHAADSVRTDWNPQGWSVDQAVRTLFVLSLPSQDPAALVSTLDQLFGTGEVGELVALYQALPLLPHPSAHVLRAAEGIRTNMRVVFCAVALHNPYPAENFDDDQWNQMVLKCQFIGVPMGPIVGLDRRANGRLSSMVVDFIHERWAAKRPVAAELWRCVGRFADAQGLCDLERVLKSGSTADRTAAALALSQHPNPVAVQMLATVPELVHGIKAGTISWETIDQHLSP